MIRAKQMIIVGAFDEARKGAPAIIRRSMQQMVRDWHKDYMPRHFKIGADRIYGYKPRRPSTVKRKRRRGLPPLVETGLARSHAKTLFRVTGSAKTVRGKFSMPRWFQRRPVRAGLPALGEELTVVQDREQRRLTMRNRVRVVSGFRKLDTRKVINL